MAIRLLYITNGITGSNGLERVLSVKASILAEQYGYEVFILGLNQEDIPPFFEFSTKIRFVSIKASGNPLSYFLSYRREMKVAIQKIQPDIISVCDDGLKGFFIPSLIKTKARIIYERHATLALNTADTFKGKIMRKVMQARAAKFDKFVVLTKSNVSEWNSNNVIVIPNLLSFATQNLAPLTEKRVIAVGSHAHHKGYDRLLTIWSSIEKQFPDWVLEIYGKVDAEKRFLEQAASLGLKQLRFHAPVKDIKSVYLSSAVLVLPSRIEGFGMVLIEAMECGVPCVAFDCPHGPADIITDTKDGFLVENGNLGDFELKMKLLMGDPELRQRMGAQAKQKAGKYLPAHIVKDWDRLFRELLQS